MTVRRISTLGMAAVAALALAGTAGAVPTIDFNVFLPPTGLLVYNGDGKALTGVAIEVDTVTATDTPTNSGVWNCIDCLLSFQTGNFIAGGPKGWLFGAFNPTSFIAVSGGLDTDGDLVADLPILMLGDFIGPQVSVDVLEIGPFDFGVTVGVFLDFKNSELTNFFGLPVFPYVGIIELGWGGFAEPPGPLLATATRGTVRNIFGSTLPAPEPASLLLLIVGLLALGARRVP